MSNDTTYQLEFRHESIDSMLEILNYLKTKKERWDKAVQEGKGASDLMEELGLENRNEVASWGFDVTGVTVGLSAWANENVFNVPISGDDGELADLQAKFPELEITGTYQDDYTYGSVYGSDKRAEGTRGDSDEPEEDETEESRCLELDAELAQSFLEDPDSVNLGDFTSITDDAAEVVSKYRGGTLFLYGLTNLSDAAADALSRHQGDLELGGLTELSEAAAEALSKHQGSLILDGLTELSDAAAEALSKHQGVLILRGLTELTDYAAEALSKHQGNLLLDGVTELSDVAAEALSKYKGTICEMEPAVWVSSLKS